MSFVPSASIYASNNVDLVYNIGNMLDIDGWPNDEKPSSVELTNLRSKGAVLIPAGSLSFDITITARLTAANYTALISAWNTLQSTITTNTNYYLHIETASGVTEDILVQRIQEIVPIRTNRWNSWVYYQITFRAFN